MAIDNGSGKKEQKNSMDVAVSSNLTQHEKEEIVKALRFLENVEYEKSQSRKILYSVFPKNSTPISQHHL